MTSRPSTLHVLLIEDDPGDANLVKIALNQCRRPSFRVTHSMTLKQGLEDLRRNTDFDVVLLDLSLPDASGDKTVTRFRAVAPELPIVILTGFDDEKGFSERMLDLGAQDYLVKNNVQGDTVARAIRYAITRMRQSIQREAMVKELHNTVEMKNRMMGILAHDLRGSIGVISGFVEILEITEEVLSKKVKTSLAAIAESAAFMNALIDETLAVAVAAAGEMTLALQVVDLAAVVRSAIDQAAIVASKKNIRLICDAEKIWTQVDILKFEQVLNNLIGNAIKFSNPGGEVQLSLSSSAGNCIVRVTDQGVGIPTSIRANLFQPFCKGQNGTAGERTNGLGLYICSLIVAAHQGCIEVESKPGHGTTFLVIIPIC